MSNKDKNAVLDITPETKIGRLLDHYPELEDLLITLSPSYKKLRNPILRKTVGKVANLRQVAQVGGIPLAELINKLREATGLNQVDFNDLETEAPGLAPPGWVQKMQIVDTLDAGPIIEAGGSPLQTVIPRLKQLPKGGIFLLITPFLPAPLLETIQKQGYRCWSTKEENGHFRTCIGK